jgi:hypothetical protein
VLRWVFLYAALKSWLDPAPFSCSTSCNSLLGNDGGVGIGKRQVHAICSLYVQGVYWGTPETMRPVVLSKIPVSAWGARKCDLCTDPENAITGVLVRCDAGMCRTWMHATCAQRHGLLQEASAADDVADPYFASCKVHCEKLSTKSAKRRWTTLSRQQRAATGAAPGRAAVMADDEVAAAVIAEYGRERQRWLRENGATVAASRRFLTDVRKSVAEREERKLTADRGPMKPELTIAFVQRYNALDAEETKLETAVKGSRAEQTILTGTARTLRNDLEHLEATRKAADAHRTALVSVVHLFRRRMASVGCDLNQPHHWLLRRRSSSSSQARGCNASASTDISPSRILSAPNIFEAPRCWKCDSKDKPFLMVECDTCHRNIHTTCVAISPTPALTVPFIVSLFLVRTHCRSICLVRALSVSLSSSRERALSFARAHTLSLPCFPSSTLWANPAITTLTTCFLRSCDPQ